jgi:hypothetical protein
MVQAGAVEQHASYVLPLMPILNVCSSISMERSCSEHMSQQSMSDIAML